MIHLKRNDFGAVAGNNLYTMLNYIESTGTQWMKTGYSFTANDVIELNVMALAGNIDNNIFGKYDGSGIEVSYLNSNFRFNIAAETPYTVGNSYIIKNTAGQWSLNGANVGSVNNATSATECYLFARNYSGANKLSKVRIFSFKVYRAGVIIKDFAPARRKSDGIIGMLDKVGNVFYANSGSGVFLYG